MNFGNWFTPSTITKYKPTQTQIDSINAYGQKYGINNLSNNKYFMNTLGNYMDKGLSFNDALKNTYKDMPNKPSTGLDNLFSNIGGVEKGLGVINTAIGGLSALSDVGLGIYNAIQADKMFKQAQEQFDFEKNLINRNLENQAKLINTQISNAAHLAGLYSTNDYNTAKTKYYDDNKVNDTKI